MHNVGVFISHSWAYTDHYNTLAGWVFSESWNVSGVGINFRDFSIPRDNPIHNAQNSSQLLNAILAEIGKADVLVCPTGMYATHSTWIEKELRGARQLGVKILAVDPWGQQKKSSVVQTHANRHVGWQKQSVIDGIWALKR